MEKRPREEEEKDSEEAVQVFKEEGEQERGENRSGEKRPREEENSVAKEEQEKKKLEIWVREGWNNASNTCDPATLAVMLEEVSSSEFRGISPHYWLRYRPLREAALNGGHEELRRALAPLKSFMRVWCTPGNGESVEEMLQRGNDAAGTNLTRKDLEMLCQGQILPCRGQYGVWCGATPSPYSLVCGNEHLRPGERRMPSREEREDARFQILAKFRAWGYDSVREMIENEPEMAEAAGLDDDDYYDDYNDSGDYRGYSD